MHAWIWMKCCVSTDVGTWTNWLTFEPDPDYSPDAGTGLLSLILYKLCCAEFYVGNIPRIHIVGPLLQQGVVLQWFYSLSCRNTVVRGTCAPPSALLVCLAMLCITTAYAIMRCLSVCASVCHVHVFCRND